MILSFPSIQAPTDVSWVLRANTQVQTSPLNRATQTLQMPGAVWVATLTWSAMPEDDRRVLEAFIAKLGGRAGRFFLRPYHAPRRATGTGTPNMNGSIQTGSTISIKGWGASAQAFKAGDFLSYPDADGRHLLHIVTADSAATGLGFASVDIAPPVRRSVPDGTAVEVAAPVGTFRLVADDDGVMTVASPLRGTVSISAEEALV